MMHKRRLPYAFLFMVAICVLAVMFALQILKNPTGSNQAMTKQVSLPTIDAPANLPAKVREIVRMLATIKEGMSTRDVIMHLGLDEDESVKHLEGGGNLGEGSESFDLGINDEWILTIDFKYGYRGGEWDSGFQDIFQVALNRGSISKFRKEGDGEWELYYPYWRKGLMIEKPPKIEDPEQAGAGQPATRSESDSEGGDKPQPQSEERSR